MLQHLRELGSNIPSSNIHCLPCDSSRAAAADPTTGNVILCQGSFINRNHMEDALTHELVHLYDQARFKVNWNNLRHHACSEVSIFRTFFVGVSHDLSVQIRAENLSGDCRWGREIQRGFISFTKQHQVIDTSVPRSILTSSPICAAGMCETTCHCFCTGQSKLSG